MRFVVVALAIASLVGCSGDSSSAGSPDATITDSQTSDATDALGDIDCSKVGCAAPPPCGEACTAPCGCCFDPSCADSGSAAPDASEVPPD